LELRFNALILSLSGARVRTRWRPKNGGADSIDFAVPTQLHGWCASPQTGGCRVDFGPFEPYRIPHKLSTANAQPGLWVSQEISAQFSLGKNQRTAYKYLKNKEKKRQGIPQKIQVLCG
jgi:hypothetical protein